MSHFLGTPARSHLWTLANTNVDEAKALHKRLLSGPTIDIYVGLERKHWSLHKNLLCYYSPYFENELQGHEVSQAQRESLELPDDDPKGFVLFVKWLYQGQLDSTEHLTDGDKYEYAVACHKLYLISAKFAIPDLTNLATDLYRSNLHAAHLVPDPEEMNEIYRSSQEGSPFRKLITQMAARQIMDPEIERNAESYRCCFESNPSFAVEMINAIRQISGGLLLEDPTKPGDEHTWHDHGMLQPPEYSVAVASMQQGNDGMDLPLQSTKPYATLGQTDHARRKPRKLERVSENPAPEQYSDLTYTNHEAEDSESNPPINGVEHEERTAEQGVQNGKASADRTTTPRVKRIVRRYNGLGTNANINVGALPN